MATRRGAAGRRTVTITDIARRVGCSISTVSAALNGTPGASAQLRATILATAREMGYEPNESARRLRRRRPGLIGVSHVTGQRFQDGLLDGIYVAAAEAGYDVMLAAVTPHHGEAACLRTLAENRCEALVLIGSTIEAERLAAVAERLPVVAFSYEGDVAGVDVVGSQDALGIDLLVDHVVASGRRRIWYVDGAGGPQSGTRAAAYRRAMARHGLGAQARVLAGGSDEAAGIAAAAGMVDAAGGGVPAGAAEGLPEAVLGYNDDLTIGMLMELRRRGVAVPEQVALAGFDGTPLAGVAGVDLTTVRQDAPVMARAALARVIARLDGPDELVRRLGEGGRWETEERATGVEIRVAPALIARASTAAATSDGH